MSCEFNFKKEIERAEKNIRPFIRNTYLDFSPWFSSKYNAQVYFKTENLQHTGSFKIRGALNKLLSLSDKKRDNGVVTASTGNHGAAVAFSCKRLNIKPIIFVPANVSEKKLQLIKQQGVEIRFYGDDNVLTEIYARQYAVEKGLTYISPYNDPFVVAGQGTIGLELAEQIKNPDAVFVSLGGGGLISGIGGYLKSVYPQVKIIGCSPENSQVMIKSIRAGKILDLPSLPTLSDGTAGGVEKNAITFDFCGQIVDEFVTVTEAEIKDNLKLFINAQHMLIEGAAAVAVASFIKLHKEYKNKNIVIILCGANISTEILCDIL